MKSLKTLILKSFIIKNFSSEIKDLKLIDKYIDKNTKFFFLDDYRLKNNGLEFQKK